MSRAVDDLPVRCFCPLDRPYCEKVLEDESTGKQFISRCSLWSRYEIKESPMDADFKIVWDCALAGSQKTHMEVARMTRGMHSAVQNMNNTFDKQFQRLNNLMEIAAGGVDTNAIEGETDAPKLEN